MTNNRILVLDYHPIDIGIHFMPRAVQKIEVASNVLTYKFDTRISNVTSLSEFGEVYPYLATVPFKQLQIVFFFIMNDLAPMISPKLLGAIRESSQHSNAPLIGCISRKYLTTSELVQHKQLFDLYIDIRQRPLSHAQFKQIWQDFRATTINCY